jgi:hypothetical protein
MLWRIVLKHKHKGNAYISKPMASKDLSSALSAEVEDIIKMEYGLLKSANLL